jgi:arylsulfatase A-like enzyme
MAGDRARPNVVLITTHDLGQHLGCYGIDAVDTPNVDELAADGVQFENAYATAPVCSPARGSLLTGRYPQSTGLMGLTHAPWWWEIDDGEVLLPEMLAGAGYETHLCGFQHVATPDRVGFGHVHSEEADAEETTAAAAEVFANAGEEPFYAQVAFTEVHRSFDQGTYTEEGVYVPPYLEATDEIREDFASFQASVNYFDDRVGEVLDALDAEGLREDTAVVLAADHGIPHPGAKWTCRKPGIEIALLMDLPESAPRLGGSGIERDAVSAVASGVDLVPTLLDVLGVPVPERVEGVSFRPYLAGEVDSPPRDAAFAQFTEHMKRDNESRAIVTEDHHLIRYFDQGRTIEYPAAVDPVAFADHVERMETTGSPRPFAQLYDVESDPNELDDLGSDPEYEATVAELSRRLLRWMVSIDDPLLEGRVRLPYYEMALEDLFVSGTRSTIDEA